LEIEFRSNNGEVERDSNIAAWPNPQNRGRRNPKAMARITAFIRFA